MKALHGAVGLGLLIFLAQGLQSQEQLPCDTSMTYENHNQIDPKPLRLRTVQGAGRDEQGGAVWNMCVGLFSEKEHKLIVSIRGGKDGRFALKDIPPGEYRLVAKSPGFCTANVPLHIGSRSPRSKTELLLHMRPSAIDQCSYGDLVQAQGNK